jgi:serine/threonine protein kinase
MSSHADSFGPRPTPPPGGDSTRHTSSGQPDQTTPNPPTSSYFHEHPTPGGGGLLLSAPAALGKYLLLEQVAAGGMGVVYKAHDVVLDRVVALKTIRSGILARPEEVDRFYNEARAVAHLHHPHIVPIYEIDQHDGQHYFTMEFAEGGTLSRRLDRYTADARAAVQLVDKVAQAVHYAHQHGILHRDLKPANILLDENDEPRVSDFGLAKVLGSAIELTQPGQQVGTPAYMAPEQAAGQSGRVGPASDVWALGVILYELLTGRRPFTATDSRELSDLILKSDPPSLRSLRPLLDRDLETIVLKCLEKDPRDRYPSAAALRADLDSWLRGEPPSATRSTWATRAWRRLRRNPHPLVWAALVMALVVFFIEAWTVFGPGRAVASPQEQARQGHIDRMMKDLKAGKDVVLVGATAPERPYPWKRDNAGYALIIQPGQPLHVDTQRLGMMILMPDPEVKRYRLEAEVRSRQLQRATMGLFVGYGDHPSGHGSEQWFCTLTYFRPAHFYTVVTVNQRMLVEYAPGKGSRFHGAANVTREVHDVSQLAHLARALMGVAQLRPLHDGGPVIAMVRHGQPLYPPFTHWEKLTLEVDNWHVEAFWRGQPLGTLTPARLRQGVNIIREITPLQPRLLEPPPFAFTPRGALGLYVHLGSAEFRNVVLKPLPNR